VPVTQPSDTPSTDPFAAPENDPFDGSTGPAEPGPRPDRAWLLGYRLLGLRLPEQYRSWVAADVRAPSFIWFRTLRTALWGAVLVGLYGVGQRLGLGDWPGKWTWVKAGCIVVAVALLSSRDVLVRRTLRWQRVDATGEPVEVPKRLARLSGVEGAMLALLGIVVWTGAATALGYGLRPTGPAVAKCRAADATTTSAITAGLTVKDAKIQTIRAVSYPAGTMVAGLITAPSLDKPKVGVWVVVGDKTYQFKVGDQQTSRFETAPRTALSTQASADALKRAIECLGQASAR
jgi:hypothetical protein